MIVFAATGQGPSPGDSAAVLLYKVAHEEPELDGMPAGLRSVAESCLAKDPAARPTPRQLGGLLAPEGGAASLVRGGWLPAALTERQWKLATSTERWIVLDTGGGTNPHPGVCPDGSADERFTLNEDGSLHYQSGDSLAGNPEGDLTKQGG